MRKVQVGDQKGSGWDEKGSGWDEKGSGLDEKVGDDKGSG